MALIMGSDTVSDPVPGSVSDTVSDPVSDPVSDTVSEIPRLRTPDLVSKCWRLLNA